MAMTRAQQNRAIRQEALREQLEAQGHVQYVVEIATKLREPEEGKNLESTDVTRLKAAADIHLKLIDKYLPSLKATEHSGSMGIDGLKEFFNQVADTRKPPNERSS